MPKSDTALKAAQRRQHAMLLGALLIAPEHRICHRGYSGIRKDEGRSWWSSLILLFVLVMTLYWREVRASVLGKSTGRMFLDHVYLDNVSSKIVSSFCLARIICLLIFPIRV